ncbi:hypothetical protein WD019_04550 [Fictibacillus sp. Mic-4]|uniref:hypothetical protein n=1 Tax=Fictibacillus sp. Mic-4 TaxID=3132826 RepID=UPI003CE70461
MRYIKKVEIVDVVVVLLFFTWIDETDLSHLTLHKKITLGMYGLVFVLFIIKYVLAFREEYHESKQ